MVVVFREPLYKEWWWLLNGLSLIWNTPVKLRLSELCVLLQKKGRIDSRFEDWEAHWFVTILSQVWQKSLTESWIVFGVCVIALKCYYSWRKGVHNLPFLDPQHLLYDFLPQGQTCHVARSKTTFCTEIVTLISKHFTSVNIFQSGRSGVSYRLRNITHTCHMNVSPCHSYFQFTSINWLPSESYPPPPPVFYKPDFG